MILTIALLLDTHSLEIHVAHTTRDSQAIPLPSPQPKPGFGIFLNQNKGPIFGIGIGVGTFFSNLFLECFPTWWGAI